MNHAQHDVAVLRPDHSRASHCGRERLRHDPHCRDLLAQQAVTRRKIAQSQSVLPSSGRLTAAQNEDEIGGVAR
jgi:hypothetical protein